MAFDALRSTVRRGFATHAADAGVPELPVADSEPVIELPAGPGPTTPDTVALEPVRFEPAGWDPDPAAVEAAPTAPTPPAWQRSAATPPTPPAWHAPAAITQPVASAPTSDPAPSTYQPEQFKPVFADPIAGGDVDAQAFTCPGCGRTLNRGELLLRCDGCGERFVLDIPARRALAIAGGGAIGAVVLLILVLNVFAAPKPAAVGAAGDPVTGSAGTGRGAAVVPDLPSEAMAALRGTVMINERLAAEAPALKRALEAKPFRTSTVIKILRRMAIDTRTGAGMLRPMAAWDGASGHQAALASFYDELGRRIDKGLAASVNSAGAYKKAAKQVLATLRDAPALDASARTLAVASGLELPATAFPAVLR